MRRLLLSLIAALAALAAGAQSYEALADSADGYMRRERWADAARVLRQAMRMRPASKANALLLSNLGVAQTNLGQTDDALRSFEAALAMAPRSTAILSNRARAYMQMHRDREALADLTAALRIDSTLVWPRRMRGWLRLSATQDIDGAYSDFRRLTEQTPDSADSFRGLGIAAYYTSRYAEADSALTRAIRLQPDDEALLWRAATRICTDRLSDAAADLSDALRIAPRNGDLYMLRAYLNRLRYRATDAEADLKNARAYGANPQLTLMLFGKEMP